MAATSAGNHVGASPSRKRLDFDLSVLANKLVPDTEGEGLTMEEITEELKCGVHKARKFVRQAIDAGECRTGIRYAVNIAGVRRPIVAYVFGKGAKK